MNQIYKNVIAKSTVLSNALKSNLMLDSRFCLLNQSSKTFSSYIILNSNKTKFTNLNITRQYETKSNYMAKFENYSSDRFRQRERNYFQKNNEKNRIFNDKSGSNEEDFVDAEPVEFSETGVNYSNKEHHSFRDFDIPEKLLDRLEQLGLKNPYEIQEKTLKHTLAGKDLVGKAFTGSGKTLAFSIPIISRIMRSENKDSKNPKCLVLTPTRELCLQLTKNIQELAPDFKCVSIVGGTGYEYQIQALNRKVDIVCATPGRLKDLMNRKNFVPDDIEIICLDEADELLTPNFIEQIHDVISSTNKKQMFMFSATINHNVYNLINQYMSNPVTVDLTKGQKHKLPTNIEHFIVKSTPFNQRDIILHCLEKFKSERCIVFTNMKREAIKMNYLLNSYGIKASDLHSDLSQRKREIILDQFRSGRLNVIVATDVAARGIDIPEVNLVIQLGAPSNGIDFYIHRSGRTGRGGRPGVSVLIHSDESNSMLNLASRLVKFKTLELPAEILEKMKNRPEFESSSLNNNRYSNYKNNTDRFFDKYKNDREYRSNRFNGFNKNRNSDEENDYKGRNNFYNKEKFE